MAVKKFKILSIDGGGIRGVYPARFLSELEADLGGHLADHFDLICGTSTGGILALALALKIPAKEAQNLYVENRKSIFSKPLIFNGRFGVRRAKYSNNNLENLVREKFSESFNGKTPLINDLKTRVCITGYDLINAKPKVFKTPHKESYHIDKHIPAYQIAMATAAAPTYFDPYSNNYENDKGEKREFFMRIDGGVFANNPSLIGLTEAHCALGVNYEDIELYSIGTGYTTYNETRSKILFGTFNKAFGKIYWMSKIRIIDLMMQAQAQHVHDLCTIYAGGTGGIKNKVFKYYRIQEELPSTFKLAMDSNNKMKLQKLMSMASNKYQNYGQSIVSSIKNSSRWNSYPSTN
ncbi:CBASS cGAMP-activated phospholipase [Gillisia hiemivivida]|uniref:Patatin n=1 Tax=Gillisia hiemivivida TaxID=291190 RepID=A0A5C7A176_9FLAO|nr:CBASS cGAMP-activated phospholipase [Gillisia hiemivivida]TXD95482.1 patatin [Gillisia hiemivivida]